MDALGYIHGFKISGTGQARSYNSAMRGEFEKQKARVKKETSVPCTTYERGGCCHISM
jgi:hypothetical protein